MRKRLGLGILAVLLAVGVFLLADSAGPPRASAPGLLPEE